jgi:putative MFS transporter
VYYGFASLAPSVLYSKGFTMAVAVFLDVGILGPRASQIELEKLSR